MHAGRHVMISVELSAPSLAPVCGASQPAPRRTSREQSLETQTDLELETADWTENISALTETDHVHDIDLDLDPQPLVHP